jgi:hypothetical protein
MKLRSVLIAPSCDVCIRLKHVDVVCDVVVDGELGVADLEHVGGEGVEYVGGEGVEYSGAREFTR